MTSGGGAFLEVAQSLWKEVCTSGKYYKYGGTSIPATGPYIDCSAFVSWVMYEYGYDEFSGWQKWTGWWMNESANMANRYGWGGIDFGPKENIVVEASGGRLLAYDCGNTSANWNGTDGSPADKSWFLNDSRPGKIFRVTDP